MLHVSRVSCKVLSMNHEAQTAAVAEKTNRFHAVLDEYISGLTVTPEAAYPGAPPSGTIAWGDWLVDVRFDKTTLSNFETGQDWTVQCGEEILNCYHCAEG